MTTRPSGSAAFVGREREFAELGAALESAGAERGALFSIDGEPRIGTSKKGLSRRKLAMGSSPRAFGFLCAALLAGQACQGHGGRDAIPVGGAPTVSLPVTFAVANRNSSAVPCASDGRSYNVRGHLVAPDTIFRAPAPRAVTLYLHGLGFGEFFWHFQGIAGYDYATELAKRGHASLVIDRIGYESSGHPQGLQSCSGSQADVAHQVIGALKTGAYTLEGGGAPPTFQRVALAGHSAGSLIAQVEAYSFEDIDALIIMAFADLGNSSTAASTFLESGIVCATGGQRAEAGQPTGYAYFGQDDSDFQAVMFHDAEPDVVAAATVMRNRDPCGDFPSLLSAVVVDQLFLGRITVPVLLVCAENDALFPRQGCEQQADLYSGANVTPLLLGSTGHAVTLERSAPLLHQGVANWLSGAGF